MEINVGTWVNRGCLEESFCWCCSYLLSTPRDLWITSMSLIAAERLTWQNSFVELSRVETSLYRLVRDMYTNGYVYSNVYVHVLILRSDRKVLNFNIRNDDDLYSR